MTGYIIDGGCDDMYFAEDIHFDDYSFSLLVIAGTHVCSSKSRVYLQFGKRLG